MVDPCMHVSIILLIYIDLLKIKDLGIDFCTATKSKETRNTEDLDTEKV